MTCKDPERDHTTPQHHESNRYKQHHSQREARPPPPLSQSDAFKKGTTPERRRHPTNLGFHPRQGKMGRERGADLEVAFRKG